MKTTLRIAGILMSIVLISASSAFTATDTLWTAEDLSGDSTVLWHRITESPMSTISYHSESMSFWCGDDASPLYGYNLNQALTLNYRFDLTQYEYPRLAFWHYLDMDVDSDDRACLDISTDNGQSWELAVGEFLPSESWIEIGLDLGAYTDQVIMIRFRFTSDAYNINDGYGWFIDDFEVRNIAGLQTIYQNDFDSDTYTDFTHYGVVGTDTWIRDDMKVFSGTHCMHAQSGVSSWSALQSPELDFSGLIAPQLSFMHWYEFPFGTAESDWSNGAIVEVTTDPNAGDAAWTKLYPVGGYPAHCSWPDFGNPLGDMALTGDADVDGFYGYQRSWEPVQFDLSAYVGQPQVWIRFSSGTDFLGPWTEKQWFVDDLLITDFANEVTVYSCDMEFIETTPEEAYADFVTAIDELPVEAFTNYKSVDKAVKRLEKKFEKHPELKQGRLLEIYEWLLRPLHQRVLLRRLDRIERKYVAAGNYEKAVKKLEKNILKHMDGIKKDWILDEYREPVYLQGLQLVEMLNAAVAAAGTPAAKFAAEVEEPLTVQPVEAELLIAPNPVTDQTIISYYVAATAQVSLAVYDLAGRQVIALSDGLKQAGTYRITWDARNTEGARVEAGNYLAMFEQDGVRTVSMVHVIR